MGHGGTVPAIDIDRFLATNQPVWDRLGVLVSRGRRGVGRLRAGEIDELVRLYQRASSHLSYVRTSYHDPALTIRLTGLVAAAGSVVYGSRPRALRAVGGFFTTTFPAAVWGARWFVAASAALFILPALAVGVWIANSPRAVEASAPPEVREAYLNESFEDYYSSEPAAQFASKVTTNNIQVAFLAFAAGIAGCVLTGYILVLNGANLGLAGGLFAAAGQQPKFWGLIVPHGLLEVTAVVIAGAAGLRLGWALIDPGDRPRAAALTEEGRRAFVIVLGIIGAFVVAGLIEGFVTGSGLPTVVRVGVGVAVEVAFLVYLAGQGRKAGRLGFTGAIEETDRGGWAPAPASVATRPGR
ncbi:MAG: stage II sporulation protein M [Acidimicrobiales bacterium]